MTFGNIFKQHIIRTMKKFLTAVIAIHNIKGEIGTWPGPIVLANSWEEAEQWCKINTQYLFIEKQLIENIHTNSEEHSLN